MSPRVTNDGIDEFWEDTQEFRGRPAGSCKLPPRRHLECLHGPGHTGIFCMGHFPDARSGFFSHCEIKGELDIRRPWAPADRGAGANRGVET